MSESILISSPEFVEFPVICLLLTLRPRGQELAEEILEIGGMFLLLRLHFDGSSSGEQLNGPQLEGGGGGGNRKRS